MERCDGCDIYPFLDCPYAPPCRVPSPHSTKAAVLVAVIAPLLYRSLPPPFPSSIVCVHLPFISGPSLFYGFWRGTLAFPLCIPPFNRSSSPARCTICHLLGVLCHISVVYYYIISALFNVPLPSSPIASRRNIGGHPLLTTHPPKAAVVVPGEKRPKMYRRT